tara:strand:- start:1285 stop:2838 length:1554 start_codon:yes stop_codon:yes gene_type:complete
MKQKYTKKFVKYFDSIAEKIILKDFKIVKYFDSTVEKIILKVRYKTNNNFIISNFNKCLIAIISLLFLYLFYISIPSLYNKAWLQNNIENKLLEEFKINFSISSDITYNILPTPHFLIKNSKIFRSNIEKPIILSDIKNLKIFISKKNLFNKEKIYIKEVVINKANFSLLRKDFNFFNKESHSKYSDRKITINDSNIFLKDGNNETVAIIKIDKAFTFFDNLKLLNIVNLKGEAFKIPFTFDFNENINLSINRTINLDAKKLKLNIYNESDRKNKNFTSGLNIVSILNSKIYTKYNVKDNLVNFKSNNSRIKNSKIFYKGQLSTNPFDLNIYATLENQKLSELLDSNSIMAELIKSKILFNKNISVKAFIISNFSKKDKFFNSANINFNIVNGKINFNQTKFFNKKIGLLEIDSSNLFFENDKLILNTNILINIQNANNFFSFLQTRKDLRKPIKNIFINMDYDFSNNDIKFNNIKVDGKDVNEQSLGIIEDFNDNKVNNLNKSRLIINRLLEAYDG